MRTYFLSFGFIVLTGALSAQAVSVGVLGGVPFTDPTGSGDVSKHFTIGPSLEFRLPANFAIEADALYRRIGEDTQFSLLSGSAITTSLMNRQRGNTWQFPILGKYYFGQQASRWRPFVGTGYSFRIANPHVDSVTTITDPSGTRTSYSEYHEGNGLGIGATAAAGVRFQTGRFAVSPQFRYTRWSDHSNNLGGRNDAAFLLGLSF
jgi:hypothetical protein